MNSTRTILGSLLVLLLALASTACNDQDSGGEPVTLEVKVVDSNGWDPDHVPESSTTTTRVSEGSTFEVEVLLGPATFEVTDINDDQIVLETDEVFALVNARGGIDLNEPRNEFTLDRSGSLEIATPTTDAGTNVTLRVA